MLINIYESVGAHLCIHLLQRLTVSNTQFIIQSSRNKKKKKMFWSDSVGAPVGGTQYIIIAAWLYPRIVLSISRKVLNETIRMRVCVRACWRSPVLSNAFIQVFCRQHCGGTEINWGKKCIWKLITQPWNSKMRGQTKRLPHIASTGGGKKLTRHEAPRFTTTNKTANLTNWDREKEGTESSFFIRGGCK